jgi:tetratricopeptide (TPR) repeat protein
LWGGFVFGKILDMKNKIIFISVFIIVIVVGIGGYFYFNQHKSNNGATISQGVENQNQIVTEQSAKIDTQKQGIITSKEPNLTTEQLKIINDRLSEYQKELANTQELSDEQKLDLNLKIGFQYYALGQYSNAENYYIEAEKYDFSSPAPYLALHQLYIDMNAKDEALIAIDTAIKLRPATPDYWKRKILLIQEKFNAPNSELDNLYREALTKTENYIDIITAYAGFLEKTGNTQKAIEYWQKAEEENPDQKSIYEKEIERLQKLL